MRILFITKELPFPLDGGAKIRNHAFIRNLANRHQIHLLSFDRRPEDPTGVSELRKVCADVLTVPLSKRQLAKGKRKYQLLSIIGKSPYQFISHYTPQMQETIDNYMREHDFDIVMVSQAQMGYYKLPNYKRCVLSQHNVEYEIRYRTYKQERISVRKLYNLLEWKKFKRDELGICSKFPLCLTTSERDREILAEDLPSVRFAVIPNGVDIEAYQRSDRAWPDKTLLFTGTIDYFPNTDALEYFIAEILPHVWQHVPEVKFMIVGKKPPPRILRHAIDPRIVVTGHVNDVREYFEKATLVVVPLRFGGGTRHKILEAMAMSKPVVSTSMGAEGLAVENGKNILIADEPQLFAQAVITLLEDSELREKIVQRGRSLMEQRYDWRIITDKLEEAYQGLIERENHH